MVVKKVDPLSQKPYLKVENVLPYKVLVPSHTRLGNVLAIPVFSGL
jgi:hypothetical protein